MRLACSRTRANSSFLACILKIFLELTALGAGNHDLDPPKHAASQYAGFQTTSVHHAQTPPRPFSVFCPATNSRSRLENSCSSLLCAAFAEFASRKIRSVFTNPALKILRVSSQASGYPTRQILPMCDICFSSERCSNLKLKLLQLITIFLANRVCPRKTQRSQRRNPAQADAC